MVDVVFVTLPAGQEDLQLSRGLVCRQQLVLGGVRIAVREKDVVTGTAAPHAVVERVVGFFVDQHVVGRVGAQLVAHDAVGQ